jgi:hypothetical protein
MIRDGFRGVKAGSGIGNEPDAGDSLLVFHDQVIDVADALYTRRTRPEGGINTLGPEIRWLKHVGVGRND